MAPLNSFLLDVYIDIAPRYKVWVQDLSPFLQGCQKLENALFTWDEISEKLQSIEQGEEVVVDVRTADIES